tara:strand:+ start:10953 stop:13241 length:2289 start_codon:yes stop_codon:yes gene_type:complete
MPQSGTPASISKTQFSTERALVPLKEITKAPHYHGSPEHERVANFLIDQLTALGLETQFQEGFVHNVNWGGLDKPKNIMGRLKGSENGKALLLLSHYDSALVPSLGASDAGSGIVTILESLRAYLASDEKPKNDIIVLFTDAEEIGLDGAKLFVNEHPWAENVGLVLNFEARGSGGPSNMILETNGGNANLIKAFVEANPEYPVASSLMYSIYKMLPNDTDSTVFREDGDIDSFFFAFIDDHYDYHTANDNFENLDRNTLQHQGSYLLPLIHYFADADLSNLKADEDHVYVNIPFLKMIHYPFSWILPMLLIATVVFILLIFFGIKKKRLNGRVIGKGFIPFLISLLACGLIGYLGWVLLLKIYPQYNEIQHGFTYNGHTYIAFFVFLSLAILFKTYRKYTKPENVASFLIAPITFWLLINTALLIYLKGGAFFIIPIYFALISLWLLIRQERPNLLLLTLLAIPALFIFAPLIQFFPVGLGLKMLVASCIFTVLVFGLLLPVFGFYRWKNFLFVACLLISIFFFLKAHFTSDFSEERQKPNSLVYYNNADTGNSYWTTYDKILDPWTQGYLGENPEEASKYVNNAAGSKYKTGYTFASEAPKKEIPAFQTILNHDSIDGNYRNVSFTVIPKRKVNLINLYADTTLTFHSLKFNGKSVPQDSTGNVYSGRRSNGLLRYYVSGNDSLEVSYAIQKEHSVNFTVIEYSYDLLENKLFSINKRPKNTMPKPFIVTDAIAVRRTISIDSLRRPVRDTIPQFIENNE